MKRMAIATLCFLAAVAVTGCGSENMRADTIPTETPYAPQNATIYADIDHDGADETIEVDVSKMETENMSYIYIYDRGGSLIWQSQAGTAHTDWNTYCLCSIDGEKYLLEYNPGMWQGYGDYYYRLFWISNGEELVVETNGVTFSLDEGNVDAAEIAAFCDNINRYLDNSIVLLSTENGNLVYSTASESKTMREELYWCADLPGDTLLDRINAYNAEQ